MILSKLTVGDLSTLIGAFLGALLAGLFTLAATQKQIKYQHKILRKKEEEDALRIILVAKSHLSVPIKLINEVISEKKYILSQLEGEFTQHQVLQDDLKRAIAFVDSNAYNISPNTLSKLYEVIKCIDTISSYCYSCSTTIGYENLYPSKLEEINFVQDRYKYLVKELFNEK